MNFKTAIKRINKDFCNSAYADYMKAEWGITVGYVTGDPYVVVMRKKLADWQLTNDCSNSLCIVSKGHLKYDCCPPGSTQMDFSVRVNCCTSPYVFNPSDGKCYYPGSTIPQNLTCPFCPPGYTFDSQNGCVNAAGDSIIPSPTYGPKCVGPAQPGGRGSIPATYQCPGLYQDFTISSTAALAPTGQCVLNPPLSAFGHIHNWPGNVNEILIASFTR
jgi:hypothetical protein